jgi:DNA-binding NarL/FixJ family response regulator
MALNAAGLTAAEIAEAHHTSPKTVKEQMSRSRAKMGPGAVYHVLAARMWWEASEAEVS